MGTTPSSAASAASACAARAGLGLSAGRARSLLPPPHARGAAAPSAAPSAVASLARAPCPPSFCTSSSPPPGSQSSSGAGRVSVQVSGPSRLDKCLTESAAVLSAGAATPPLSRSAFVRAIREGRVFVNGAAAGKAGVRVRRGDVVEIDVAALEAAAHAALAAGSTQAPPPDASVPLDVLYEDAHIAVVNKCAGYAVHPSPGRLHGTIAGALLHRFPDSLSTAAGPDRPGIVHRLDMDTSGVMLVARTDAAHGHLTAQFLARTVRKHYAAVVVGLVTPHARAEDPAHAVDTPLARHPCSINKFVVSPTGKDAHTRYRGVRAWRARARARGGTSPSSPAFSLLDVQILTGRTHQIRVHLASCGHPVCGDSVYHRRSTHPPSHDVDDVLMLAARSIEFRHPATDETLRFEVPLPTHMQRCIEWLEANAEEIPAPPPLLAAAPV